LSRSSPNLAVSANPSSLTTAGTTALTATVTNPNGNAPTGTVTFASGTTVLGVVTLSTAGGSATRALRITGSAAGIALGANTITAVYQGDSANNQATATVLLTVVGLSSVTPSITALTNAASYRQSYAPEMVLSIYGSNLALSTSLAGSAPLPTSLDTFQ
jgi:Bacterial Ig-like domain (group 3)